MNRASFALTILSGVVIPLFGNGVQPACADTKPAELQILSALVPSTSRPETFKNPLSVTAPRLALAQKSPLFSVATWDGVNVVAAGRYGVIVHGSGHGDDWQQAEVPVSNDLVALAFGDALNVWAVGHGGVVLHSADGGQKWVKQLDGHSAGVQAHEYYRNLAGGLATQDRELILQEAGRWEQESTTQPFLDVWFKDNKTGFIVGTFNRILRTDDSGKSWVPLIDKIDNPQGLHFYAVRGNEKEVYLAGEAGHVWRWDEPTVRFVDVSIPYEGALFGLIVTPEVVLAYGMRGSLFRSLDRGATWEQIPSAIRGGIVSADVWPNGNIVIAGQSGEVLVSSDQGATFTLAQGSEQSGAVAAIAATLHDDYLVVGVSGVGRHHLAESAQRNP